MGGMIVHCPSCGARYADEFRWTICPHETFAANDGKNNFGHHPESFLEPVEGDSRATEGDSRKPTGNDEPVRQVVQAQESNGGGQ